MYKVLIVDDEPWVAYGLAHLIDWNANGFEVIGEAHDGVTALQLIIEHVPDVVVSDIRMPGLDGIQLLEKLKQQQLDVEVILVSGYSEFQYAQQALRLGAFDYLLKQVEAEQLLESLQRISERLRTKRETQPGVDLFLHDLFELLEPSNGTTVEQFLQNKGIQHEQPHFRFISCELADASVFPLLAAEQHVQMISTCQLRTGLNKWAVLINYDEQSSSTHFLDYLSELTEHAQYAGISSRGYGHTKLALLYDESEVACCSAGFYRYGQLMSYKKEELDAKDKKMVLQIELAIKEGDLLAIKALLGEWSDRCSDERIAVDRLTTVYNQFISLLLKYYGNAVRYNDLEHLPYDQLVRFYRSPDEFFSRLEGLFELMNEQEAHVSNDQAKKIIAYIDQSYTEDILLSSLAKQFNLSIGYLSMLVKKETGKTYSEYVTEKRLALAKELLGDQSISIQDIVQRVGYKDYFHFNKLFKKHFGITPSKYRKL